MIKVENVEVFNFEGAIRGCRNPLNSWSKSDSGWVYDMTGGNVNAKHYKIGENDLDLMRRLYVAGQPHRKYLRQIFVSMDIVAPLYWWKEMDQYKVGTTTDSCSTMHKIHDKEFTLDDFSHEHMEEELGCLRSVVNQLNLFRNNYIESNRDKRFWWQMIQLLPSSYNQRRTLTMNYENVANIIEYRSDHKLDEWRELCRILKELPYVKEIMEGM